MCSFCPSPTPQPTSFGGCARTQVSTGARARARAMHPRSRTIGADRPSIGRPGVRVMSRTPLAPRSTNAQHHASPRLVRFLQRSRRPLPLLIGHVLRRQVPRYVIDQSARAKRTSPAWDAPGSSDLRQLRSGPSQHSPIGTKPTPPFAAQSENGPKGDLRRARALVCVH